MNMLIVLMAIQPTEGLNREGNHQQHKYFCRQKP
uniref:Uncharacterized protein n=1 Tax=Vibrio vulnificus TaxID=672 RepID=A0A6S4Q7E0_VIBVL|nr:hypothetical protein [Vibrio vulnificus]